MRHSNMSPIVVSFVMVFAWASSAAGVANREDHALPANAGLVAGQHEIYH